MLRVAGWFDPLVAESNEMLYQSEAPYLFDSGKFTKEFGFPGTPYAAGIRRTAESRRMCVALYLAWNGCCMRAGFARWKRGPAR